MSTEEKNFDVLILGAGENALKALESVQANGQTALWIDMDQNSLMTLICQKNRSSSTTWDDEELYQVFVDKQTITTTEIESTTFVFQAKPALPKPHFEEFEIGSPLVLDTPDEEVPTELIEEKPENPFISFPTQTEDPILSSTVSKEESSSLGNIDESSSSAFLLPSNQEEEHEESSAVSTFLFRSDLIEEHTKTESLENSIETDVSLDEQDEQDEQDDEETVIEEDNSLFVFPQFYSGELSISDPPSDSASVQTEEPLELVSMDQQNLEEMTEPEESANQEEIESSTVQNAGISEEKEEVLEADIREDSPKTFSIPKRDVVIGSSLLGQKSLLWNQKESSTKKPLIKESLLGNQIFEKLLANDPDTKNKDQSEPHESSSKMESSSIQASSSIENEESSSSSIQIQIDPVEEKVQKESPVYSSLESPSSTVEELESTETLTNFKVEKQDDKSHLNKLSLPQINTDHLKDLIKADLPSQQQPSNNESKPSLAKPNLTRPSQPKPSIAKQNLTKPSQPKPEPKRSEVTPIEPFTSRRRSRANKKSRLFANIEPFKEPTLSKEAVSKSTEASETIQPPKKVPPIQPEDDFNFLESSTNDQLKRDDIEFEDAYGGYSSWEEFLTPFSQGNRKRQEMDKLEKRKLALRGLHNLINNLG